MNKTKIQNEVKIKHDQNKEQKGKNEKSKDSEKQMFK